MSTILDQYGSPARNRFARAVNSDPFRGLVFYRHDESIHRSIPQGDRRALAALSRKVVFNTGPAKAAITQKAQFTVGEAFAPRYLGEDNEEGQEATDWLEDTWFGEFDFLERAESWGSYWEMISKSIDRDGDVFIVKASDPDNGRPRVVTMPAYACRSEGAKVVDRGEFDGAKIEDGVISDEFGRTLGFRFYTGDESALVSNEYDDIPAASVVHLFDRDFPEQRRGFPAFAHSLSDILQGLESKELEILRQIMVSNILLVNKGRRAPTGTDPGFETAVNSSTGEAITREQVAPGIYYLNGGEDMEAVLQKTPGEIWESFQDRLWNEGIIGAGWATSLCWKSPKQGTAERSEVVRARLSVRTRYRTLRNGAVTVATWGLSDLRAPKVKTFRWTMTKAARMTVDDGREARADLELVKSGGMSEEEFQANRGNTLLEHQTARARAIISAHKVAAALSSPGIQIDPKDLLVREGAPAAEPEILLPDD